MSVSAIIRKRTNLSLCPAKAFLFRKIYLGSTSGSSFSAFNDDIRAPLPSVNNCRILRHMSVSPTLQIFAKLTSFLGKLAVEPDGPQKPLEHKLSGKADCKLENMHKEIVDNSVRFLEEYDKSLNELVKQVKPPAKEITKGQLISLAKRTYKKKERALKSKEKLRFFHFDKLSRPIVTSQFNSTYTFLQFIGLPCDELQYFPDIQRMTKDEILMCLERLRSNGINKVFSLFLIQRTLAEMKIGLAAGNPTKMRDGRTPVPHLSQVRLYLSLCQMLQQPDLDIISLLDMLTNINGYESMATLQTKVKKLLSVGATPEIIWNNLELLTSSRDIFDRKIKLYKRSRPSADTPFPVALFLSKSFVAFQERLNVGQDVLDISDMLGISSEDFQACWGFKKLNTAELVKKVRMCIKVGINQKDVFNNLSILNSIPMEKCYEVTTGFQETGLPASIFIFREMHQANGVNGGHLSGNGGNLDKREQRNDRESEWAYGSEELGKKTQSTTTKNKKQKKATVLENSSVPHEEDEKTTTTPVIPDLATVTASVIPKHSAKFKKSASYNTVGSSKRSRRVLFHLVAHVLALEPETLSRMFRCNLSTTAVHRLDVTRNLDFLLSPSAFEGGGFTLEQLAQCPLILVHPHARVKATARSAAEMVDSYLVFSSFSSAATSSSSSSPSTSSLSHRADVDGYDAEGEDEQLDGVVNSQKNVLAQDRQTISSKCSHSLHRPLCPSTSLVSSSTPFSTLSPSSDPDNPNLDCSVTFQSEDNSAWSHPVVDTVDAVSLKKLLFSCPHRRLNLLQYLLEKDSSFSLGASCAHVDSGFLNRLL